MGKHSVAALTFCRNHCSPFQSLIKMNKGLENVFFFLGRQICNCSSNKGPMATVSKVRRESSWTQEEENITLTTAPEAD